MKVGDGYRGHKSPGHPLSMVNGLVRTHRVVLWDSIGPDPVEGTHRCHWCTCPVEWFPVEARRLVVDHLDGDTTNNDPSNLVPACDICNLNRDVRPALMERRIAAVLAGAR